VKEQYRGSGAFGADLPFVAARLHLVDPIERDIAAFAGFDLERKSELLVFATAGSAAVRPRTGQLAHNEAPVISHRACFSEASQNHFRGSRNGMQDAVDKLIDSLLNDRSKPTSDAWNRFGDHGESEMRCPLFKTDSMCSACCDHFTRDLFDGESGGTEAAFDDAYTRFRLTARREVSRPVFRHLAAYACRRCPNNPMRGVPANEVISEDED
jgi:hypothetical protein